MDHHCTTTSQDLCLCLGGVDTPGHLDGPPARGPARCHGGGLAAPTAEWAIRRTIQAIAIERLSRDVRCGTGDQAARSSIQRDSDSGSSGAAAAAGSRPLSSSMIARETWATVTPCAGRSVMSTTIAGAELALGEDAQVGARPARLGEQLEHLRVAEPAARA